MSTAYAYPASGAFATPLGAMDPAAIGPGGAFEFTFEATEGDRVSIATMFVASNDLFYTPSGAGITLFDGNTP